MISPPSSATNESSAPVVRVKVDPECTLPIPVAKYVPGFDVGTVAWGAVFEKDG